MSRQYSPCRACAVPAFVRWQLNGLSQIFISSTRNRVQAVFASPSSSDSNRFQETGRRYSGVIPSSNFKLSSSAREAYQKYKFGFKSVWAICGGSSQDLLNVAELPGKKKLQKGSLQFSEILPTTPAGFHRSSIPSMTGRASKLCVRLFMCCLFIPLEAHGLIFWSALQFKAHCDLFIWHIEQVLGPTQQNGVGISDEWHTPQSTMFKFDAKSYDNARSSGIYPSDLQLNRRPYVCCRPCNSRLGKETTTLLAFPIDGP